MNEPLFIVVDLFCGAGGTTTGFVQATLEGIGVAKVIACVNHDPKAIQSHWRNHPEVKHFEEDIRTLDLTELVRLTEYYRNKYPDAYLILWASLECTNFSKAKGGQPRDADSRTLADHLDRYIIALQPDYIQIENVVEFMSWGPLDEKGKPVSRKNGQDWMRWRKLICDHGYVDDWKELNSANYGAYTSRNRLFGIFARPGLPIVWPEPTHARNPSKFSMHGDLQRWKAVKEVLDFSDEGESIFNRKTPLVDASLERIYAGLVKFVAKGDTSFIAKYFSGRPAGKVNSIGQPAPTVTTFGNQALVQAAFIQQRNSGEPDSKLVDIEGPARTLTTTGGNQEIVFLSSYYGNGSNNSSVENPAPTLVTKDRIAVVSTQIQSIDQPAGTVMPNDKHRVVTAQPFIMPTNYDNKPKSIDEPSPTITANRKHHYLVNPSHGGHSTSADAPCPVIIARQDKAPLYLITATTGTFSIPIYDTDSEVMVRIKQFMAVYGIVDIKMRMLRVHELLRIQGFPADYQLAGNQADQKKFIGNSVVPLVVQRWTEALAGRLLETQSLKIA